VRVTYNYVWLNNNITVDCSLTCTRVFNVNMLNAMWHCVCSTDDFNSEKRRQRRDDDTSALLRPTADWHEAVWILRHGRSHLCVSQCRPDGWHVRRGDDRQYTVDLVPVQRQEGRIDRRVEHKRKLYCLRHTEADSREIIECGMTNFRIGTHRHTSAHTDTHRHRFWPRRHGKTGTGVWKYSFRVLILGRLLAK